MNLYSLPLPAVNQKQTADISVPARTLLGWQRKATFVAASLTVGTEYLYSESSH